MATAPTTELVPAAANAAAAVVLFDQDKFDAFYAKLRADIDAVPIDLTTKKGRDAIASAAAKVRTEKASIDRDRKRLTQEWRDNTALVNGAWKGIEARLDDLAVTARKPLTDWEEAEKARVAAIDGTIAQLKAHARVDSLDTAAMVRERGTQVWNITLDPEVYQDRLAEVEQVKAETVDALKAALARLTKEEADRAELEKLREEKAQAEAAAQAQKEQREAEEAAEAQRRADEQRAADERAAEAQRIEDAKAEAAAAVQREAEEKAALVERKRTYARQMIAHIQEVGLGMIGGQTYPYGVLIRELTDKIKINDDLGDMQAEVAAIRDATLVNLQAAMERQAERDKESAEREKQRLADVAEREKREAEELAAHNRRLNQEHRSKIKTAAKAAIMTCGADEETARKIVMAIIAGEVPAVSLEF